MRFTKILALAVLLLCASTARSALISVSADSYSLVGNAAYFGQTFTALPGGATELSFGMRFFDRNTMPNETDALFRVLITETTSAAIHPATVLYESDNLLLSAQAEHTQFVLHLPDLPLVGGNTYIWLLDLITPTGNIPQIQGAPLNDFGVTAIFGSGGYVGGARIALVSTSGDRALDFLSTEWFGPGCGLPLPCPTDDRSDLAFTMRFGESTAQVIPEPSTGLLIGLALFLAVCWPKGAVRKARVSSRIIAPSSVPQPD